MGNIRNCGKCSLCCKLLEISEINSPMNSWCEYFTIGRGCSIYQTRPESCRNFKCLWLLGFLPENEVPSSTGIIIYYNQEYDTFYFLEDDKARGKAIERYSLKMLNMVLAAESKVVIVYRKERQYFG